MRVYGWPRRSSFNSLFRAVHPPCFELSYCCCIIHAPLSAVLPSMRTPLLCLQAGLEKLRWLGHTDLMDCMDLRHARHCLSVHLSWTVSWDPVACWIMLCLHHLFPCTRNTYIHFSSCGLTTVGHLSSCYCSICFSSILISPKENPVVMWSDVWYMYIVPCSISPPVSQHEMQCITWVLRSVCCSHTLRSTLQWLSSVRIHLEVDDLCYLYDPFSRSPFADMRCLDATGWVMLAVSANVCVRLSRGTQKFYTAWFAAYSFALLISRYIHSQSADILNAKCWLP